MATAPQPPHQTTFFFFSPDLASFPPQYLFHYYNDERDQIMRQFNHMQALWGKGTYFLSSAPGQPIPTAPVDLENEYNVFKVGGEREKKIFILLEPLSPFCCDPLNFLLKP